MLCRNELGFIDKISQWDDLTIVIYYKIKAIEAGFMGQILINDEKRSQQ